MNKDKGLFTLFLTMAKIGLFTFGGGFAMIALLENEFVTKKKWIEKNDFLNMIAITGSAPGSVGINAATYIGYKVMGFKGSLVASVAACIPSFVIIYLISLFFDAFLSLTIVSYAFTGIRVCVIYLILTAGISMLKGVEKNPFSISVILLTIIFMVVFSLVSYRFSTIFYILISGMMGVGVYYAKRLIKGEENLK